MQTKKVAMYSAAQQVDLYLQNNKELLKPYKKDSTAFIFYDNHNNPLITLLEKAHDITAYANIMKLTTFSMEPNNKLKEIAVLEMQILNSTSYADHCLAEIFVDPNFTKRGIASALLECINYLLASQDINYYDSVTTPDYDRSDDAQLERFYKKNGFKTSPAFDASGKPYHEIEKTITADEIQKYKEKLIRMPVNSKFGKGWNYYIVPQSKNVEATYILDNKKVIPNYSNNIAANNTSQNELNI